jgi:hypothetical protein
MRIARIRLFPIKSLDGIDVAEARVLPSGALEHDRRFALALADGTILNAKRLPALQAIRTEFSADLTAAKFRRDAGPATDSVPAGGPWRLREDSAAVEAWFGAALSQPVRFIEDRVTGFPDDLESPGPTLVSLRTWDRIADWFAAEGIDADSVRRRFRTNLEVRDLEPFGEDRFFGSAGALTPFAIGPVRFVGVNPCQRCAVPGRDPASGVANPGFQAKFSTRRQAELPAWSAADRFNHFYRLTVNTRLAEGQTGGLIHVGDEVRILL